MLKKYELDIFGEDGEHLATVIVYGRDDDEIDEKLGEASDQLDTIDEAMDADQAFAQLSTCDASEMPAIEDWTGAGDDAEPCEVEAEGE